MWNAVRSTPHQAIFQDHFGSLCQFFLCKTLDTDMILIFYHSLVVKILTPTTGNKTHLTSALWNCNSNIFALNSGLHSLKGMSGPFGVLESCVWTFWIPTWIQNPAGQPRREHTQGSLCVHRLFLCKIKPSRSLYFILEQQLRRNSTTPDSCELGQTKLFPSVGWLECLFVLMWLRC